MKKRAVEHGAVEIGAGCRRMALVRHVEFELGLFTDGFHEGEYDRDHLRFRIVGDPDRRVGELFNLMRLVLFGPGHHDHRDASGLPDDFGIKLHILFEIGRALCGRCSRGILLQENDVEHRMLEFAVLHPGVRVLFMGRQIERHVMEGERTGTDGEEPRLHVFFRGARFHEAAQICVDAAVVEGVGVADQERDLRGRGEWRRDLRLHSVFERRGRTREENAGSETGCDEECFHC